MSRWLLYFITTIPAEQERVR